jgi:hypothetical protein
MRYSSSLPIFFMNPSKRKERHDHWKQIVKNEEVWWEEKTNPTPKEEKREIQKGADENNAVTFSAWESSKSAVLGLASGYQFNIYERMCNPTCCPSFYLFCLINLHISLLIR